MAKKETSFLLVVMFISVIIIACQYIGRPAIIPVAGECSSLFVDSGCLSDKVFQDTVEDIQTAERKCPVAQVLPYGGPVYGAPFAIHKPRTDGTILVEIDSTVDFEAAKEVALQWIRDQGYEPANLGCDIQFQASSFLD